MLSLRASEGVMFNLWACHYWLLYMVHTHFRGRRFRFLFGSNCRVGQGFISFMGHCHWEILIFTSLHTKYIDPKKWNPSPRVKSRKKINTWRIGTTPYDIWRIFDSRRCMKWLCRMENQNLWPDSITQMNLFLCIIWTIPVETNVTHDWFATE